MVVIRREGMNQEEKILIVVVLTMTGRVLTTPSEVLNQGEGSLIPVGLTMTEEAIKRTADSRRIVWSRGGGQRTRERVTRESSWESPIQSLHQHMWREEKEERPTVRLSRSMVNPPLQLPVILTRLMELPSTILPLVKCFLPLIGQERVFLRVKAIVTVTTAKLQVIHHRMEECGRNTIPPHTTRIVGLPWTMTMITCGAHLAPVSLAGRVTGGVQGLIDPPILTDVGHSLSMAGDIHGMIKADMERGTTVEGEEGMAAV